MFVGSSMPLDLLHSAPQHRTAFWEAKPSFRLLGLASTVLLASLAGHLSAYLLLSALPQICAVVRCYLLRRYIFFAINFMLFVILMLRSTERDEKTRKGGAPAGAGEFSPDVWFDASPPSTFQDVPTENSETPPASALPFPTTEVPPDVWFDAEPPPASSPLVLPAATAVCDIKPSEKAPALPPPPSSPPVPPTAVGDTKPLKQAPAPTPPVEEDDDSMDATWKAITGMAHLKKSNTWSAPPPMQLEPAAGGELRKSETFQEEAAAASARRAVLEKRMKGKKVEVAEDYDVMNRRFEAFINKFKEELRLQRLASLGAGATWTWSTLPDNI